MTDSELAESRTPREPSSGRRGTNLPRMGDYNSLVVLDRIRRSRAGISRVEIAAATGLSVQTISNLVARLLEEGMIGEGARAGVGRGKPRTLLHARADAAHAIGLHVDPLTITFVLLDLTGAVVHRVLERTPERLEDAIALMAERVVELSVRVPAATLRGLGVAAPGPIDAVEGRVVHPPLLSDWGDVPLRSRLATLTGLPTILDKDVTAAMAAELWQRHHDLGGTTLFSYLGYGVGFAFAREGELLPGSSRNAGESGHLIVDPDGPECFCGRRGCLGVSSSLEHLISRGVALGVLEPFDGEPEPWQEDVAMSRLAEKAEAGDSAALEILRTAGRQIAHGIVLVADLLDADRVVFGGLNWERLAPYITAAVTAEFAASGTMRELHEVAVEGSELGPWVGAVGAASLVLDEAFTPKPSALVAQLG
ncbi:ROK family transcriptional regulator [Bogoriella caseilytica]|uniref:Putative NBD/HSP70 family sugar kinase n=1 Tax=Bogoriella caseilytica TaxID=56055 RepID=A0A3N2BF20_9MICO|nr:ROK family transcriptional regulator [Bogoriella caseilytica]ROR73847.1 putative NBD/HSP70 family sugar kinase [Bogoriella caseilytica]